MIIKKDASNIDAVLEQDIKELSAEILEKSKNQETDHRQVLRSVLEEKIKDIRTEISSPLSEKNEKIGKAHSRFLPDYLDGAADEVKLEIEKLIDYLLHHGLYQAIKLALSKPANITDAFRDAITDKLYQIMKERKYL